MNDSLPRDFEQRIADIVEPIAASSRRKRAMQEELLAHLLEIHREELSKTADERTAQVATIRRFGNIRQLRRQLQSTVPWTEHFLFAYFFRKEIRMSRWMWIVGCVVVLLSIAITFPEDVPVLIGALVMLGVIEVERASHTDNALGRWLRSSGLWMGAVLVMLFGTGIILPALAKAKRYGYFYGDTPKALTLGLLMTLSGVATFGYCIVRKFRSHHSLEA